MAGNGSPADLINPASVLPSASRYALAPRAPKGEFLKVCNNPILSILRPCFGHKGIGDFYLAELEIIEQRGHPCIPRRNPKKQIQIMS